MECGGVGGLVLGTVSWWELVGGDSICGGSGSGRILLGWGFRGGGGVVVEVLKGPRLGMRVSFGRWILQSVSKKTTHRQFKKIK